jgi:hypothetical protein
MSAASSRGSAASSSGSKGRGSRSSGRSSSTHTAGRSSSDTSHRRAGSRTCARPGRQSSPRSTSSAAASPARTSPAPAREPGSTAPARVFGPSSPGSFASYDPATCSWRTSPPSSPGKGKDGTGRRSAEFSGTWPKWGTTRSGRGCPLASSGHPTFDSGSGSSPTREKMPTPRSSDGERGGRGDLLAYVRTGKGSRRREWPTPHGMPKRGQRRRPGPSGNELGREVLHAEHEERIPTPTHADSRASRNSTARRRPGSPKPHAGDTLTDFVTLFPTPRALDATGVRGRTPNRTAAANARAGRSLTDVAKAENPTGQLNPTWVEWLMGFPTGWTVLPPSATR